MALGRADQKALLYNDNWIYKEDDCHFDFTVGNYLLAKGCNIRPVLYQDLCCCFVCVCVCMCVCVFSLYYMKASSG